MKKVYLLQALVYRSCCKHFFLSYLLHLYSLMPWQERNWVPSAICIIQVNWVDFKVPSEVNAKWIVIQRVKFCICLCYYLSVTVLMLKMSSFVFPCFSSFRLQSYLMFQTSKWNGVECHSIPDVTKHWNSNGHFVFNPMEWNRMSFHSWPNQALQ